MNDSKRTTDGAVPMYLPRLLLAIFFAGLIGYAAIVSRQTPLASPRA